MTESNPGMGSRQPPGRPCGLPRRLMIMLYDGLVVTALLIAATALAMAAGLRGAVALQDPLFTLYLAAVWFLYLGWCWHRGGMTVGMRAWQVRIEDERGERPGWGRCLLRFIVSLLSLAALGVGFAWSLIDRNKRSWHDIVSKTHLLRR